MNDTLTQERLKDILQYDPETGIFHWKVRQARRIRVGQIAGTTSQFGYRVISIGNKGFKAHRLAWLYVHGYMPEGILLDHINNDPSDNRIANLRLATESQNQANSGLRKDNTSFCKGVSYSQSRKKWVAQISSGGKRVLLGRFATLEEARDIYAVAAKQVFKEFSRLA